MKDGDHLPRVLVVAEEPSIRERAQVALARLGRAARSAETAETAASAHGYLGAIAMLQAGDLELDASRWTVHRAGTQVELAPTEFRLLIYLMSNQGRVLTRGQILENVWGRDEAHQPQIVDTYVSYLRRKLNRLGPPLIHTQRGVGYSLLSPRSAAG